MNNKDKLFLISLSNYEYRREIEELKEENKRLTNNLAFMTDKIYKLKDKLDVNSK